MNTGAGHYYHGTLTGFLPRWGKGEVEGKRDDKGEAENETLSVPFVLVRRENKYIKGE